MIRSVEFIAEKSIKNNKKCSIFKKATCRFYLGGNPIRDIVKDRIEDSTEEVAKKGLNEEKVTLLSLLKTAVRMCAI